MPYVAQVAVGCGSHRVRQTAAVAIEPRH